MATYYGDSEAISDSGGEMNNSTISTLRRALADLKSERDTIDAAITSVSGLINKVGPTPGRPAGKATAAATRRKPRWTAAARKAAAVRMKQYWNKRRKVTTKAT